jgi:hypothetical protein
MKGRIEPSRENAIRDFNKKELEELLIRRISMFRVDGYW